MSNGRVLSLLAAGLFAAVVTACRPSSATPDLASSAISTAPERLVGCYELRWIPDSLARSYSQASVVDEDRMSVLWLGSAPYGRPVGQPALRVERGPRRRRSFPHVFWSPRTDSSFVVTWADGTLFGGVRAELMLTGDSVKGHQYTFSDVGGDREPWSVRGVRVTCSP